MIIDKKYYKYLYPLNKGVSMMIEFSNKAVGKVVRKLRKERGLSQEVFSGLAGIARSHLSMIESGDKHANFETLWKIANAFEILPHELIKLIEKEIDKDKH